MNKQYSSSVHWADKSPDSYKNRVYKRSFDTNDRKWKRPTLAQIKERKAEEIKRLEGLGYIIKLIGNDLWAINESGGIVIWSE